MGTKGSLSHALFAALRRCAPAATFEKTAAVYLLLNCLDGAATETEIARLLEIDRGTARCHLHSLAAIGLVERIRARSSAYLSEYGGYCLTPAGRQLLSMIVPQGALQQRRRLLKRMA